MDKKNTLIGISLIFAAFALFFFESQRLQEQQREAREAAPTQTEARPDVSERIERGLDDEDDDELVLGRPTTLPSEDDEDLFGTVTIQDTEEELEIARPVQQDVDRPSEKTETLRNDFIEVDFTSRGGAIREVRFLQTLRGGPDHYVFNEGQDLPALNLSLARADGSLREYRRTFEITEKSSRHIVFEFQESEGLLIRRTFRLSNNDDLDPYEIRHELEFFNQSETALGLPEIYLSLGVALPVESDRRGEFLNLGYYNGDRARFRGPRHFRGSGGFFGIGARAPRPFYEERVSPLLWATVKNQFFTTIITPDSPGSSVRGNMVTIPAKEPGKPPIMAVTGNAGFTIPAIPAGGSRLLAANVYIGPKEFLRLQAMNHNQDLVMKFGWFGFFSKILLSFMHLIHNFIPSWGWSIVVMTICLKLLFWPLTGKAAKSQKRMSKIAEPMKALQEKYKDNPQKKQQEMIKLFKQYKVNPAAGCLPILVQIPIFIGLFWMLRSASELRMAPFLWVQDLSQPDTLFHIFGLPFNLLPLIMGTTMFIQMRIVPMSPTMDPMQRKIFQFLPLIFLVILYNFSAGLVLYWTVQNLLTILQTWTIHRRPDPELEALGVPADGKVEASTEKVVNPNRKKAPPAKKNAARKRPKGR